MFNSRTYVVTKNISLSTLPKHALRQHQVRRYSTGDVTKFTALEFKQDIRVRIMTKEDLQMVMSWAKDLGWNPGKYAVESLYEADPRGYKILEVDGEPVASLASVKHSANFAFLGLYIVREEFRKKGYGEILWNISMGTLANCNSIGLNGVIEQVERYRKVGFVPHHYNTRWGGLTFRSLEKSEPAKDILLKKKDDFSFSKLVDYDARIFATPREAFLKRWLEMPDSFVLAAIDDGLIRGYGVVSTVQTKDEQQQKSYKIAPLFADNEAIAEKIYKALSHSIGEEKPIYLDTAETNPHAVALANQFGLEKQFDTLRMYYKGRVPEEQESKKVQKKVFGLTTLEIG